MVKRLGKFLYTIDLIIVGFILVLCIAACLQVNSHKEIPGDIIIYGLAALLVWLPGRGIKFILCGE